MGAIAQIALSLRRHYHVLGEKSRVGRIGGAIGSGFMSSTMLAGNLEASCPFCNFHLLSSDAVLLGHIIL